jgi:hypothetical protein
MLTFTAAIIIIINVVVGLSVIKLDIIDGAFLSSYTVDEAKRRVGV